VVWHDYSFNAVRPLAPPRCRNKNNITIERRGITMAREKMVTRTVTQTTAEVMTIDVTTAEVQIREYTIGGTYDTNELLLKKLQKLFQTDTFKLVNINSATVEDLLLGMTEEDFIRYATVLPPRNARKESEAE
jgi:hypothetical protein